MVAAADGVVEFKYQTTQTPGFSCDYHKGTDPSGKTLYEYGYYAKITHTGPDGKTFYTRYAHMEPGSNLVASGVSVTRGTPIARSGDTGCSSGPHTHFEYLTAPYTRVDPAPYMGTGSATSGSFRLGLTINGMPAPGSEISAQTSQQDYSLPLDLTRLRLQSGGRYPIELTLIDATGARYKLNSGTLIVNVTAMRVSLTWDKVDTDVDLRVSNTTGAESWYGNLCGLGSGNCLDRDDVDGFGPEVFTLLKSTGGMVYTVRLNYYSDHSRWSNQCHGRCRSERTGCNKTNR